MVEPADSTVVAMRTKVRRLTGSPSASQLSDDDIDKYINTFYTQDFVYAIKIGQLKTTIEIFTEPNIDRYALAGNTFQGIREPVYIEGVEGYLFKDRASFYRQWPRFPTEHVPTSGDGTTGAYTFTIAATPFLRHEVTIGAVSANATEQVEDDGAGNLVDVTTGADLGDVDYITGVMDVTFTNAIPSGNDITVFVSPYTASRPSSVLYYPDQNVDDSEIIVRPVPDKVYRIELEAYQTPTQFAATSDSPILNQWYQYISLGASIKVLQDRQDMEGLENVMVWFKEQEALVLERAAVEQIGVRNSTIYSGSPEGARGNYGAWF